MSAERNEFRPQKGPQEKYTACSTDIAIFGGAAGGGKTFATLLDILRHKDDSGFGATIFRRNTVDLMQEGSIWDESENIYPLFQATGSKHNKTWKFPSGATVRFAHLEHEKTRFDYQGAQIPYIAFEELTQFTEKQFWYLTSRNRSPHGGKCYIRGTCNPDPDSFVRKLVDWYIDPATGYALAERSGLVRWFIRVGDKLEWGDSQSELKAKFGPEVLPRSFTFIASKIEDNPALLKNNPGYLATLMAMGKVEREQLRFGNWNIRPAAGLVFNRSMFDIVDVAPLQGRTARYWDRAATPKVETNDPDWTAGVKARKAPDGFYYVLHVERFREAPTKVIANIKAISAQDGKNCDILLAGDPAAAGKFEVAYYVSELAGYAVKGIKETEDKETRAVPVSAQAGARNIKLVRGPWNEDFLRELESFPDGGFDDQVDGFTGVINELIAHSKFGFSKVGAGDGTGRTGEDGRPLPARVAFRKGVVSC